MRRYINYDKFYDKLVNHLPIDETWRLDCEDKNGEIYHLVFTKHLYEAEDGNMYQFIVYAYPKTLDARLLQEDEDSGWDECIFNAWYDMTWSCSLKPFIEE